MCLGCPVRDGSAKSRSGRPSLLRPAPISQFHVSTSSRSGAVYQLLMMTPVMSAKDSFSAPDWVAYTSLDVDSMTPWVSSCPMTSR